MSKELNYLVFAMEQYRCAKGISGAEVADIFSRYGLYDLVLNNYYLYHIESPEHMLTDLDTYIKTSEAVKV